MSRKKIATKRQDKFVMMTNAINDYMKEKGVNIAVIQSPYIQHKPNELKYNHELVFRITAIIKPETKEVKDERN